MAFGERLAYHVLSGNLSPCAAEALVNECLHFLLYASGTALREGICLRSQEANDSVGFKLAALCYSGPGEPSCSYCLKIGRLAVHADDHGAGSKPEVLAGMGVAKLKQQPRPMQAFACIC